MVGYITRRALGTLPVIVLISMLVFLLLQGAPGDPADILINDEATEADVAEARARWGLDQPVFVQYWNFLKSAVLLDFGESFRYAMPVVDLIAERFPATLELALFATLFAILIGVPLGLAAGARPNSWIDNIGSVGGFFGISMPNFWLAIMLILLVSGELNLLPSSGRHTFGIEVETITGFRVADALLQGQFAAAWDALLYIVMPAFVLGINMAGILMRITRSAVIEVMSEDYIMTARAKGLAGRTILWRHALRNAMVTVVTIVGLEFGALLSGSIIVETVFSWPGIGQLLLSGLGARDYPLITGVVLVYTTLFIVVNLIVDLLYAVTDPRIDFER